MEADKWAFALGKAKHIPTWTEPHCLEYLAERAAASDYIIESGTYMGHSAKVMLAAAPFYSHLWCIDRFDVFGTEQVSAYFLREEIRAGRCELIKGDSNKGAEMLQHMNGKIDLVWVDDGHSEQDVLRDIRCLLPLLRAGGILCGHDFDMPHNDVARGVIASGIKFHVPVPRLWSYVKP